MLSKLQFILPCMKTFLYKLYTSKHNGRLHQQINIGGVIHNHCIALHRRYYRRYKKHLPYYRLKAHITTLKKRPKYRWWTQLGSQAIQNIVERIDKGYQRFFQHVRDRQAGKTTQRVGPPTFRKVCNAKSFTLTQAGWKLLGEKPFAYWHHGLQVCQVQSHRRYH